MLDVERRLLEGVRGSGPEQPSASRGSPEDEDSRDSLTALSRLASNWLGLDGMLARVATYAVRAVPGADGAGLTLIETDRADTS